MSQPQRLDAWNRLVTPQDGAMGEWFNRGPRPVVFCDLCSVSHPADPDIEAVTGMWVCTACVEDMLDASTDSARAEVGMVAGGGGRA